MKLRIRFNGNPNKVRHFLWLYIVHFVSFHSFKSAIISWCMMCKLQTSMQLYSICNVHIEFFHGTHWIRVIFRLNSLHKFIRTKRENSLKSILSHQFSFYTVADGKHLEYRMSSDKKISSFVPLSIISFLLFDSKKCLSLECLARHIQFRTAIDWMAW